MGKGNLRGERYRRLTFMASIGFLKLYLEKIIANAIGIYGWYKEVMPHCKRKPSRQKWKQKRI